MKEQIKTLAVKVFGMTDDEAQSLFTKTDDGEQISEKFIDILSKKDRERLDRIQESLKPQLSEMHDKGFKKAQKEILSKVEKEVKEKYGYETDKPLTELIDDLVSMNKNKGGIEDIKTHPDYIKLERSLQSEYIPKDKFEELTTEFEGFKTRIQREAVMNKVKEDARSVFRQLNPILSKDPKKASNQEAEFLSKLESFDYQVQEDGNHVIFREGNRLENQNLNPIAFNEFIKEKASTLFDFAEQDVKGNSGVDGPGAGASVVRFADEADFLSKYRIEQDPEKRIALYKSAQKQGIV